RPSARRSRRGAEGDELSFAFLPAGLLLRSDSNPGRGSPDERDAEVATKAEAILALEAGDTRAGVGAARVLDWPVRPRPAGPRRQTAEHLQADDRAVAKTGLRVVAVTKLAAILVQGRSEPHHPAAQCLAAGLDRDLGGAAFRVPEADGRRSPPPRRHGQPPDPQPQ